MSVKSELMLEPRQLNDVDNAILDFMVEQADRVNPGYISEEIDQSRSYVSQRLKRLKEHGHVDQPHRGLWELVDDPRSDADHRDQQSVDLEALRSAVKRAREAYEDVDGNGVDEALEEIESLLRD